MHGIVINLDKRVDRWIEFQKQQFPFPIERFSAITASRGEDGCTMSHLAVISRQTEYPFIVFEDDCQMIEPWDIVEKAMAQLPYKWDALFLGATLTQPLLRHSANLFYLKKAFCLHAVIYNSPDMVKFILHNHHTKPGINLDIFYCKEVLKRFNCFITYPLVAIQRSGKSDICQNYVEYGEKEMGEYYKIYTDEIYRRELRIISKPVVRIQSPRVPHKQGLSPYQKAVQRRIRRAPGRHW